VIRRRIVVIGLALLSGVAFFWGHGLVMRQAVFLAIPWLGKMQGYEVRVGEVRWNIFTPAVLRELKVSGRGTELRIDQAEVAWRPLLPWGESPGRWIERVSLRGVGGSVSLAESTGKQPLEKMMSASRGGAVLAWLPRIFECEVTELRIVGEGCELALTGTDLLLSEDRAGWLNIEGAAVDLHGRKKDWKDLAAVTAWRGGVAYVADLALADNVHIDTISLATVGDASLMLESRAFGGYVYADLSRDGRGEGVKVALTVLNLSLAGLGEFAGLADKMQGRVDLAKLTFNGETSRPFSGQLAVRLEARDFAWEKRSFRECNMGLSLAGRRLRLNEFQLGQKNNRIRASGLLEFPQRREAWRQAAFEVAVDADVRDVRALAELIGGPWKESSGSVRIDGQAGGKLGEGNGWLGMRGWNLQLRGVPVSSLEVGMQMNRSDIKISGCEAWSGGNFLRASGEISLADTLGYRGRMEMRVSDMARYLEPLGRFAPDWAREGGVLFFWDGDGSAGNHSGVTTLELVQFSGDLNSVPVNVKLSATYSPGNLYLGRCLLTRGPLSLSTVSYFGPEGLAVEDLQVFNGGTRLLQGDMFLPLSFAAVLERRPWRDIILPKQELKATLRTDDLELGSLAKLFGQQSPIRGRVDWTLKARGKWTDAELESRLSVSGLQAEFPSFAVPPSRMAITAKVVQRKAEMIGTFTPEGGKPIEVGAVLPVMGEAADGRWTLLDRQAPWEVSLAIPATDVMPFRLRNGRVRMDAGQVSGNLHVGNTPSAPVWSGQLELQGGRCHLPGGWRTLEEIRARVSLDGTLAKVEEAGARAGGGQWSIEGSVDGNDWRNLQYDLAIKGEGMELFRNEILDLCGNVELRLSGDKDKGEVKGDWNLAGSRLLRGLVVSPLPPTAEKPKVKWAAPFRALREPFAGWGLDVRLHAPEVLPASLQEGRGSWRPGLRLSGTLGEPLLEGAISLTDFPVKFPAAVLRVARGAVNFTAEHPWMPQLELVAAGEVGGYQVRAAADGLLGEGKLTLTSFPALSAEQLLALLQKGSVPWASENVPGLVEPETVTDSLAPGNHSWLSWDRILGLIRRKTSPEENSLSTIDGGWSAQGGVVRYEWFWR
jgi:hypothetical protein